MSTGKRIKITQLIYAPYRYRVPIIVAYNKKGTSLDLQNANRNATGLTSNRNGAMIRSGDKVVMKVQSITSRNSWMYVSSCGQDSPYPSLVNLITWNFPTKIGNTFWWQQRKGCQLVLAH